MKFEITFEGFDKEEEAMIHHDFLMLIRDEIKPHIELITAYSTTINISDDESKITFRKIVDS